MAVELEKRVKSVLVLGDGDGDGDDVRQTFAQRAEAYYSERPQLLSLLQQLYSASQVRRRPSDHRVRAAVDKLVEEVVMGGVQMHLLERLAKEEGGGRPAEAELRRKVELQRSLVEVLESERLVLLKENASLRYDNQALAWQAAELGTCLVRLRRAQIRRRGRRRGLRATVGRWVRRLHELLVCGARPVGLNPVRRSTE